MSNESDSQQVATEVRDFYERYPYPPPRDNLDAYRRAYDSAEIMADQDADATEKSSASS